MHDRGSGTIYGYRLLKALSRVKNVETHLVMTKYAKLVLKTETRMNSSEAEKLANFSYDENNFMAPIASGSFRLDGTIVVPCSMKTLSAISTDYEANLVVRAAGIALKERWPLILMPRETPLSTIQIHNMLTVSKAGAIVMPPMHPYYFHTNKTEDLVDMVVGRVLSMLKIENDLHMEWGVDRVDEEELDQAKHL